MKKTYIILFLLVLFLLVAVPIVMKAQNGVILQGICQNEKGKAIENASVYVRDSVLVSITDENGCFAYKRAKAGDKFRFAHVAYEPVYYTVKDKDLDGKPINISMNTKKHELLEVEVTANAPRIAFDNPVRSVVDYVIADDGIYLVAYRRHNTALLHLSFEMDTLHEMRISSSYENLYKDFYGFIHVISNENACQIGFTETINGAKKDMFLYAPISMENFYKTYALIVAASDSIVITGRYAFYGLEQYYYCVTPTADTIYLLEHIVDEVARDDFLEAYDDRFYFFAANFFPSMLHIYNPIYCIDNKFYLFAYTDHETVVYDVVGRELERYPLTFHEYKKWNGHWAVDKRWKKSMMVDRARKEFYTFFVNDGLCTLMRIDLPTGTAKPVLDLSGYPFAELPRVHDGVLYFLYPTGNNNRKSLYQVKIEP
ncbi:MAG: carboxypeptidase-like regulatory domain-containing protein [Bacteroidales bacterium]|nr:carboxypeptidase-like regulatory domain-containing protein [Bacteroidales bacterium]